MATITWKKFNILGSHCNRIPFPVIIIHIKLDNDVCEEFHSFKLCSNLYNFNKFQVGILISKVFVQIFITWETESRVMFKCSPIQTFGDFFLWIDFNQVVFRRFKEFVLSSLFNFYWISLNVCLYSLHWFQFIFPKLWYPWVYHTCL